MELPAHPDTQDGGDAPNTKLETTTTTRIVVGILIAIVIVVIVLHLTGVVGPLAE